MCKHRQHRIKQIEQQVKKHVKFVIRRKSFQSLHRQKIKFTTAQIGFDSVKILEEGNVVREQEREKPE